MSVDVLPDSRARDRKGATYDASWGCWLIPVYCANCGKQWGMVPEHHMRFAFVLCQGCAETHGDPAHVMKEPDQAFFERMAAEREQAVRRNPALLQMDPALADLTWMTRELENPNSALSKLAEEWRKTVT